MSVRRVTHRTVVRGALNMEQSMEAPAGEEENPGRQLLQKAKEEASQALNKMVESEGREETPVKRPAEDSPRGD